jgi:hypothetical protein
MLETSQSWYRSLPCFVTCVIPELPCYATVTEKNNEIKMMLWFEGSSVSERMILVGAIVGASEDAKQRNVV